MVNQHIENCRHTLVTRDVHVPSNSAFTLATLELGQTSLILFPKYNNRATSTWEVPVVVLLSTFNNKLHQSGTVLKLLV